MAMSAEDQGPKITARPPRRSPFRPYDWVDELRDRLDSEEAARQPAGSFVPLLVWILAFLIGGVVGMAALRFLR